MKRDLFNRHVARALEAIPTEFQKKMENVEVLVEDFADDETLDSLGIESAWDLLGLYVGVPITQQSVFSFSPLPERIYLYRRPILRAARHGREAHQIIREVVIHEIGHHFGFDDAQLEEMEGRSE